VSVHGAYTQHSGLGLIMVSIANLLASFKYYRGSLAIF